MEKPIYLKDPEDVRLFNELRKKVNQRVESISENRDIYIQMKAVLLPLVYMGLYFLAVLNAEKHWLYMLSFVLMGISLVLIYLNLILQQQKKHFVLIHSYLRISQVSYLDY